MSSAVFDSSAVLAYVFKETGWNLVEGYLSDCDGVISAVNAAEVFAKAVERVQPQTAQNLIADLGIEIVPFCSDQAWLAAGLRRSTREFGLSLGDRACLALAQLRGVSVLTSDKAWTKIQVATTIVCIR